MSVFIQWVVVGVIGAFAVMMLLRHFGIIGAKKDTSAACGSGGCSHCGSEDRLKDMLAYMEEHN